MKDELREKRILRKVAASLAQHLCYAINPLRWTHLCNISKTLSQISLIYVQLRAIVGPLFDVDPKLGYFLGSCDELFSGNESLRYE